MTAEHEQKAPAPKGLLWSIAYFLVVGLVVGGIYLLAPDPASEPVPVPQTSGEPVADAAAVILPSVVSIQTESGQGSGVIYSEDGLIVTAAHIVEGAESVRVRFPDGGQADAEVLGLAPDVDIAVIKVEVTGLLPASFSGDKPRVGQLAVAVGNPFTLDSTVTSGIISAVDRTNCPEQGLCVSMIQTDAAINPGNSGGPLVNRLGDVVGINVSIFSQSGSNEGVGFAVPTETVISYAERIISGEPLEAAFLGVSGTGLGTSGDRAGALITVVEEGTGAEAAGLMVDDIVVSLDGVLIMDIFDLAAQVRTHQPGDTVTLVLIRNGDEMSLDVTLGTRTDAS